MLPQGSPYQVAIMSAHRLRIALENCGLVISSLRGGASTVQGLALVELGGCSAQVADPSAERLELAAEVLKTANAKG
jgi:hypothetical protein